MRGLFNILETFGRDNIIFMKIYQIIDLLSLAYGNYSISMSLYPTDLEWAKFLASLPLEDKYTGLQKSKPIGIY